MTEAKPAERRRADAERNIARILDTAVALLGEQPEASMADLAAAAGVARQTVYAHYDSREALLAAVAERAMSETLEVIDSVNLRRGSASEALDRLIHAWWEAVEPRARVLEGLATAFPDRKGVHEFHSPILERIEALVRRGQRRGEFDKRLRAGWMAASFLALVHAAAEEVASKRLTSSEAEAALARTVPRVFGV